MINLKNNGSTSTLKIISKTAFGLIVVPIIAGIGCAIAIGTKLASEFYKRKGQNYLEKYTLWNNTAQILAKMYQKNSPGKKISEVEYDNFIDRYNQCVGFANGSQSKHIEFKQKNYVCVKFVSVLLILMYLENVHFKKEKPYRKNFTNQIFIYNLLLVRQLWKITFLVLKIFTTWKKLHFCLISLYLISV